MADPIDILAIAARERERADAYLANVTRLRDQSNTNAYSDRWGELVEDARMVARLAQADLATTLRLGTELHEASRASAG